MQQRILIADDDEGIRDIFKLILEAAGYCVDFRSSGEDIINNKFIVPDLFLLDKQLGDYSGLDLCAYLKKREDTRDIPVIMISASPDIAKLSIEAGADAYIEKPFEIDYLRNLIQFYIERPSVSSTGETSDDVVSQPTS
ncbi:response regulator [Lacibacter sp. H375]|uniref:response regulator n=1 Tax=Lacibacter sp. H375 TaxID=3133424 RepID=UPI0030BA7CA9